MHIYKTYNQKALNDQYNNRARVADFGTFIRQWDYRSKRLRQDVRAFLNIAYGSGRREELDIFPSGKDSAIQVFFHGGYWMAMDKQLFHFVAKGFLSDDVTVIVNYLLAPNDTMDKQVIVCGADHFSILDALVDRTSTLYRQILRQLTMTC